MPQQRHDQPAMPVEFGGAPHDGHDTVGPGQFEQSLDLRVGQLLSDAPER